jgi:hypothetical protein
MSYLHNDFVDTIPTRPAPLRPRLPAVDESTLKRYRTHGIECPDADDAARDYEAQQRRDTAGKRLGLALMLVSAAAVLVFGTDVARWVWAVIRGAVL